MRLASIVRKLMVLVFAALLAYLLFLILFSYSLLSFTNQAQQLYSEFDEGGITQSVKSDYQELLGKADGIFTVLDSPLLYPIVALSGREQELEKGIELYGYSRDFLAVVPEFAGFDGPKRYFIAFQNLAEARGTGGLIGAYAVMKLDRGQISIEQVGSNATLQHADSLPIKLPKEFANIYRSDPAMWLNSNMSPHFPYGARIWLALWQRQFKEELDGVVTLDPIVLRDLLSYLGPLTVRERQISSQNVVRETLSDAYLDFEDDNLGRKQYLVEIIEGVARAALDANVDQARLLWSINSSILENRVLLYSTDRNIQKQLRASPLSGVMSKAPSNEYRLVLQNTAGNKMDYYLDRELILQSKSCRPKPVTQATFTITNTVSKQQYLPSYVKGRLDLEMPEGLENSTAVTVFLYGPPGAKLLAAADVSTGGSAGFVKRERDRQALVIPLELAAGEARSFQVDFRGGRGVLTSYTQPLVRPQKTAILDGCR